MKKNLLSVVFNSLLILSWVTGKAQLDSAYSIIVAGHAYGAHNGENIGLHPPFLKKLEENLDSNTTRIFLTGDIVNHSTVESWTQVEKELDSLKLDSWYVMGNHDNNSLGYDIFKEKHGGAYYSFTEGKELFVVLNSTKSDRSISPSQLIFLEEVLAESVSKQNHVFIFFHEVIWNSHEKYRLVRSNSRSRYDKMIGHSNFWEEVYPMLINYREKEFYLFAGDVGGNPDAISASYDKWENVTLLSSGMGEVEDENYMQVDILPDTVKFTFVPLNDKVKMKPANWYNVPEKPLQITGPVKISPPEYNVKYQVSPVFNATSYQWNLSSEMTGTSDSSWINLSIDGEFKGGEISVSAVNDGFGESELRFLEILTDTLTSNDEIKKNQEISMVQNEHSIYYNFYSENPAKAKLRIFNVQGKLLLSEEFLMNPGFNVKSLDKSFLPKEIVILELSAGIKTYQQKLFLY